MLLTLSSPRIAEAFGVCDDTARLRAQRLRGRRRNTDRERSSDFVAHLEKLDRLYGPRPGQTTKTGGPRRGQWPPANLVAALAALASGQSARMVTVHRATRLHSCGLTGQGRRLFQVEAAPKAAFRVESIGAAGVEFLWRSEFGDGWAGRPQDDPAISD